MCLLNIVNQYIYCRSIFIQLDFKTSTPALSPTIANIRKKCEPSYRIYHVKSEAQRGFCLETTIQKSLSLSECDSFPLEQQWNYFQTVKSPFYHICVASGQHCVTVISSSWLSSKKPEVTLKEGDLISWQQQRQQWDLDVKTSQLRNTATGLCLEVFSSSVKKPVSSLGSKWKFEMNPCIAKEKAQKWSIVRVRDHNNVTLCGEEGK